MTDPLGGIVLPRPAAAVDAGPLDERLYDLVEARFRRLVQAEPITASFLGIHAQDGHLGDPSRDTVLGELAADREHLAAIEALDPAGLSASARFEWDLEIHNVRRAIFDVDVARRWERRSFALDALGDALFLLFARDYAPLPDRLVPLTERLEAAPAFLAAHRTRERERATPNVESPDRRHFARQGNELLRDLLKVLELARQASKLVGAGF